MLWLGLALLCAFSLATADALTKKTLSDHSAAELTIIRFGATALVLSPLLVRIDFATLPAELLILIALLLPLEIIANLLYMSAVRTTPLSLTLPYLAFTPALVTLTGYLFVGESVTPQGYAGIALVVAGAWWLSATVPKEPNQGGWRAPLFALARTSGSRKMLAVAVLYSITSAIGKRALAFLPGEQFAALYYALLGLVTLILFTALGRSDLRALPKRPHLKLAVGFAMGVMIVSHFAALERVEVAYFIAVKRTSLLFGILYGAILFKERQIGLRLLAGGLMVAGVALIAW